MKKKWSISHDFGLKNPIININHFRVKCYLYRLYRSMCPEAAVGGMLRRCYVIPLFHRRICVTSTTDSVPHRPKMRATIDVRHCFSGAPHLRCLRPPPRNGLGHKTKLLTDEKTHGLGTQRESRKKNDLFRRIFFKEAPPFRNHFRQKELALSLHASNLL